MKHVFILSWFVGLVFASCNSQSHFVIQDKANPWKDNYFEWARMEQYKEWGAYNVHDPACKKIGDYYYVYSTDAIFAENKQEASEKGVPLGYIQVRRSNDLVNWEFVGWAFPEIPEEAVSWVRNQTNGRGATNSWAPYLMPYQDRYRLYFCVSAFGRQASYIGLAESTSPEGPWIQKGCVVKTSKESLMNAIDPSIIENPDTGQWWMHYGSFFGGLYCVELNPETGLPVKENDQGHLIARRANYRKDNLEAPEIIYHPELKKYFLFSSYDPLMTTYNVRVGRSDKPEGPFFDFNGLNLKDTTNNFPILTAPYRFENHPGWAGTGHCGIVNDGNGHFFMLHQSRLSPHNAMMVLHVRPVFFTPDGWPVVSPERYTGTPPQRFRSSDMAGEWEIIRLLEPSGKRTLEAGQVLRGEGELKTNECNTSFHLRLDKNGNIKDRGEWHFSDTEQFLKIRLENEILDHLLIFAGHDWENRKETVLFTGLDSKGRSVWGKRIN